MGSRVGAMIAGMKTKGKPKGQPKLDDKALSEIKVKGFKPIGKGAAATKRIKV